MALKIAHIKYPKGTIFLNISGSKKEITSSGVFNLLNNETNDGWNIHDAENENHVFSTHYNKWAEIVEKKEPLFTTIDGVGLNEGSECHWVTPVSRGGFKYNYRCNFTKGHLGLFKKHPNYYHLFSTKEAAEAWIECANENLQNYQLERLTDKKGYIFVVNHKGTLITYIAKDKQEAEGFSDLWKGFNYTINEITLPK